MFTKSIAKLSANRNLTKNVPAKTIAKKDKKMNNMDLEKGVTSGSEG